MEIQLPFKYKARDYQVDFWKGMASGKKRACLVWHRRSGKDLTVWNYTIMQAFLEPGNYFYFFPSYSQGRKVIWEGKDKTGTSFLSYIPKEIIIGKPNQQLMQVRIKCAEKTGEEKSEKYSLIQIVGTDNFDSIMGTSIKGCVFSEYSLQDPKAWQFIRPILTESGGWAIFVMTPRGNNHGKELFDMANLNESWFCQKLSVEDTKHDGVRVISEKDIQDEKESGMSEDYIRQEFFCSFECGIDNSYYGWCLEKMRKENRICSVSWQPHIPVHVSMDLGYNDDTVLIFFQIAGKEIHVIDYYENRDFGLEHYAKVIKEKAYTYGRYFAPHDSKAHHLGTGTSAYERAMEHDIHLTVLPTAKISIRDGIDCVRSSLEYTWIDEKKCSRLITCLENYQKTRDESNKVYREKPKHNWASHAADAFRYACLGVRLYGDEGKSVDDDLYTKMLDRYLPSYPR